jgi:hypothetical protein
MLSSQWPRLWTRVKEDLERDWGALDYVSSFFDFQETHYYDQELGTPIQRCLVAFARLVAPERLVDLKLMTNTIEARYTDQNGRRQCNLDPGLLFLERLVLATGKNYTHRIYLGQGVWADLTLIYQNKGWQSLPWTYPSYTHETIQQILDEFRRGYKLKLQNLKEPDKG